jgi:uncharacterized membrane protein YfcA
MHLTWILAYLLLGSFTGLLAGLFGVGGGAVMVPVLTALFTAQGFAPEHRLHLALGTSMAAIVPTAISSLRAHHRRGGVLWGVVVRLVPGILVGTFAATFVASRLPARPLAIFFVTFMSGVAWHMFSNREPKPGRGLPGTLGLAGTGAGIGGLSALVAIGGGSLTVPFLTWCNVRLQTAIGTSAAVGLPIALSGAFGYAFNGFHAPGLPPLSLGFIYGPAVLFIASASALTAPVGVHLAHRLPVKALRRLFALLLVLLAAHMLHTVLTRS